MKREENGQARFSMPAPAARLKSARTGGM